MQVFVNAGAIPISSGRKFGRGIRGVEATLLKDVVNIVERQLV